MPKTPKHSRNTNASQNTSRDSKGENSPRREPLQDNYYYEFTDIDSGRQEYEDISSYSDGRSRKADQAGLRRSKQRGAKMAERYRANGRAPRRRMSLGSKIGLVIVLLLAAAVGLFAYMFMGLKVTSLRGDLGANPGRAGVKNIALFGVDSRDEGNQGRSDAIMVLSLDSNKRIMKMASIMRDSYVNIDGYGYDKLTHAYAYGGPELAIRTLNQNFNLDIEDYVTVNFYKMAEIVDAFGGVELELSGEEMREVNQNLFDLTRELEAEGRPVNIKSSDYFTALDGTHNMIDGEYEGGKVRLSGVQAVAYARIRHLDGDEYRAGRQQQVLMGLVKQANIFSYPAIAHGVLPNCETSLGLGDIAGLMPFALMGFDMQTLTLPGEAEGAYGDTVGDMWVYCFDEELMREHLHQFLYG